MTWDTIGSSQRPRRGEPRMQYHQITSGERYAIAALRRQGLSVRAIARDLGRAPSTICARGARATAAARRRLPRLHGLRAHQRRGARRSRRNSALRRRGVGARRAAPRPRLEPRAGRRLAAPARAARGSATRPSTCTSGATSAPAASSGGTCGRRARSAASATAPTTRRGRLAGKRHISERPAEVETRRERRPLGDRHGDGQRARPQQRGHPGRARHRLPRSWASSRATAPRRRRRAASS